MLPDAPDRDVREVRAALAKQTAEPWSGLQLYLHVPFCAQTCRFCAFSGGNSLEFAAAESYAALLVEQMFASLAGAPAGVAQLPVRSVHIGGGSPDLLGPALRTVLRAVRRVPGVTDATEVAVECTLSTAKEDFVDAAAEYGVSKISFGIQSFDPTVRRAMRQPVSAARGLERMLRWTHDRRIPTVNADLITGMPGQTIPIVDKDLRAILDEPRLNTVSSYVLTTAAAPALVAAQATSGDFPRAPAPEQQAWMRLHTYSTLQRGGWVRRGTNTYVCPDRMSAEALERISGNECIGTADSDDFLIAVGAQAISSYRGMRVENLVDVDAWKSAVQRGDEPWHLPKCSTVPQPDAGLWLMPLRWEGLPRARWDRMRAAGAITAQQVETLRGLVTEGLVTESAAGFELSILGEVFMGHLVRELKQPEARAAVDAYVAEGHALGRAIAEGALADNNAANDRQRAPTAANAAPRRPGADAGQSDAG